MAVTDYSASTNWNNEQRYLTNLQAQGGGNAAWATKQLNDLNTARSMYQPVSIDPAVGSVQNAMDMITGLSSKSSARSLEYAQQHQNWSAQQAQIASNFNAAEAAKNRAWQEYMSSTSHQREIRDLKAAGLNPILSAQGGNGAAVTSGSSASAAMPSGSAGQSDQSANASLVALLGSMLTAQTSLANQALSAQTNMAIADKQTAMSEVVARITAAASMANAQTSAAAARYGADKSYQTHQDFPSTLAGLLSSSMSTFGTWSDLHNLLVDLFDDDGARGHGFSWPNKVASDISSAIKKINTPKGISSSSRDAHR